MLDWSQCPAVARIPGKVSGEWLFKGTRVPVRALFENLESGARIDDFLVWFPGVTRQQVELVLRHAEQSLVTWGFLVFPWMKILFDQGTPAPLRRVLKQHIVSTVHEMGWGELGNGELLKAAESEFEVLVTTDKNLR